MCISKHAVVTNLELYLDNSGQITTFQLISTTLLHATFIEPSYLNIFIFIYHLALLVIFRYGIMDF